MEQHWVMTAPDGEEWVANFYVTGHRGKERLRYYCGTHEEAEAACRRYAEMGMQHLRIERVSYEQCCYWGKRKSAKQGGER